MLGDSQSGPEPQVLEHHPHTPMVRRQALDHPIVEVDLAVIGPLQPGQQPRQGRLARSRRPEHVGHAARPQLERDIVDGRHPAVPLHQSVEQDPSHRSAILPASTRAINVRHCQGDTDRWPESMAAILAPTSASPESPSVELRPCRQVRAQQIEQGTHLTMHDDRMAEMAVAVNLVTIPTALADTRDETAYFKVGDDPLHGSLGDPHTLRHLTQQDSRLPRDAEQHVPVVGQKGPGGFVRSPFRLLADHPMTPGQECDRKAMKSSSYFESPSRDSPLQRGRLTSHRNPWRPA